MLWKLARLPLRPASSDGTVDFSSTETPWRHMVVNASERGCGAVAKQQGWADNQFEI